MTAIVLTFDLCILEEKSNLKSKALNYGFSVATCLLFQLPRPALPNSLLRYLLTEGLCLWSQVQILFHFNNNIKKKLKAQIIEYKLE